MKIHFDKSSLSTSGRQVITGIISIMPVTNAFFPEQNWNDNIVLILNSWIENAQLLKKNQANEAQFNFFDGSFSFQISKRNTGYMIELMQDSRVIDVHAIDFIQFVKNLAKLSIEMLEETNARGWESNSLDQLKLSAKALSIFDN